MKVWKTGVHSRVSIDPFSPPEEDVIRQKKVFYGDVFVTNLMSFFRERNYGDRVTEIYYREFCLKEGYNERLLYYGAKKKIIDCAIVEDYQLVLKLSNKEYGIYLAGLYIERSQQFADLKIKDFDVKKYIEDLQEFFKLNRLL